MSALSISSLQDLPPGLAELEAESLEQGFSMLTRLRTDWENAANRFDQEGEILFGAYRGARLVGVGGLNIDPFAADPSIGRLRHLYVLGPERQRGVGTALVRRIIDHATGAFGAVRLRTSRASGFYERVGFAPIGDPQATHAVLLG